MQLCLVNIDISSYGSVNLEKGKSHMQFSCFTYLDTEGCAEWLECATLSTISEHIFSPSIFKKKNERSMEHGTALSPPPTTFEKLPAAECKRRHVRGLCFKVEGRRLVLEVCLHIPLGWITFPAFTVAKVFHRVMCLSLHP